MGIVFEKTFNEPLVAIAERPMMARNEAKGATGGRAPPKLVMKITLNALEHLGLKMYTSLPAVIAEFVANCWDAGATLVDIRIPKGPIDQEYTIQIEDNGIGMTIDDINQKFLIVGRARRTEEKTDKIKVKRRTRRVIGRKGLGKLAGFGVAGRVELRSRKSGNFLEFRMDYDEIKRMSSEMRADAPTTYEPEAIDWGRTKEPDGTVVKLTHLKREREVSIAQVRRGLARHFSVIGSDFIVRVNGRPITLKERDLRKECEWVWRIKDEPIDKKPDLKVNGWIGTMKDPVPPSIGRGIVVMARGKLIQEPTTFDIGGRGITGQHALAYIVGELHAEFLDSEEDFVATGRRSVIWEMGPASQLRDWANKKIKKVCEEWAEKRREKKMKVIRELPTYRDRIANLPSHERKVVDGFLANMAVREDIEPDAIERMADFLAGGVEYKAFLGLMKTIEEADVARPEVIIEFFNEWEVLDAIDMIRVVEGRLEAIRKFQELVEARAKEVPTLHRFIVDNPWLLDPTWDYLDDEVDFRRKLIKQFPESKAIPEKNRRIDFLCLGYGRVLNVIELKRPESTIGRDELEQLEHYVDHVKTLQGTDPTASYSTPVGYLIGGQLSRSPEVHAKAERLKKDSMHVRTYSDIRRIVLNVHKRFIDVLERKAERTRDKRLLEGLERLKKGFQEAKSDVRDNVRRRDRKSEEK